MIEARDLQTFNPLGLPDEVMHLWSPAHLLVHHTLRADKPFIPHPHLSLVNDRLVDMALGKINRFMVNMHAQSGKSWLTTKAHAAWRMLLWPATRVMVVGYSQEFVDNELSPGIRSIVGRYAGSLGIKLRRDTSSKAFWRIDGPHGEEGQIRCAGFGGAVAGFPADIFIIDDLVKGVEVARSRAQLDALWSFYQGEVLNRLRTDSQLSMVGTRWSKWDPMGRVLSDAATAGQDWNLLTIPALCESEDDILGREIGEPMCESLQSRKQLEGERKTSQWFGASRQQRPIEEEGVHFQPSKWPTYTDLTNAYQLPLPGGGRTLIPKQEVILLVCVDWATTDKKHGDYTAIGVFGILPDGRMLVLEVVNKRTRVEECAPLLASVCRKWKPHWGASEANPAINTLLQNECRRYREIPELRALRHGNVPKVERAGVAIDMGGNGRIYLPDLDAQLQLKLDTAGRAWLDEALDQLQSYTGIPNQGHDDIVDVFGYAAKLCQERRGYGGEASQPVVLTAGLGGGGAGIEQWW